MFASYPFVRLLPAFIAGILYAYYGNSNILFVGSFVLAIVALTFSAKATWLNGVAIFLFLFASGIAIVRIADAGLKKSPSTDQEYSSHFAGKVLDVKNLERFIRAEVEIIETFPTMLANSQQAMVYFKIDSLNREAIRPGFEVWFSGKLQPPKPPLNPGEFDYREWLLKKNISLQGFVNSDDWKVGTPIFIASDMAARLMQLRNYCEIKLEEQFESAENLGVAKALLLGSHAGIDPDVREAFTGTGTIHILAVSGLHVGIIFLLLKFLFKPFYFLNRKGWPRMLVSLVIIWLYALLTGLSPSVSRAALMFSIVIIGEAQRRRVSIINSLAVSAFILLCINPALIFNIGFQLSYMAVAGIVLLAEPIQALIVTQNKIIGFIWQMAAVSIAAQLATLPVILYNFHQFPVYFIIANLLVLPIVPFMLGSGILFLLMPDIPLANMLLGKFTEVLIDITRLIAEFVYSFPAPVITGIAISLLQAVTLCFIILFACLFLVNFRQKRYLIFTLTAVIVYAAAGFTVQLKNWKQHELTALAINGKSLLKYVDGTNIQLISIGALPDSSWLIKNNSIVKRNNETISLLPINDSLHSHGLLEIGDLSILWFGKNFNRNEPHVNEYQADFILLSGLKTKNLDIIITPQKPKLVIIDGQCKTYLIERWRAQLDSLSIPYRVLMQDGAYIRAL